jgi:hypothetical protein
MAALAAAVLVGVAAHGLRGRAPEPGRLAATARATRPVATPAVAAPGARIRPTPADGARRVPRSMAPAPTGLAVEVDVPGADVFVDRVYKGKAPLTLTGVAPGPHRLNVSAEGYDGYAETVEISGGAQTLVVRLKGVRLDAAIDVVHKHALGSCRGRLSATPAGLRYAASKKEDSFEVPLSSIERLEADYPKKSLAVKLRGGRTYNFGEPAGRADVLLAFDQAVTKARSRLAAAD